MNFKKLCGKTAGPSLANPTEHRQFIRALMFLVNTRLDICFSINTLSKHMIDPFHAHRLLQNIYIDTCMELSI